MNTPSNQTPPNLPPYAAPRPAPLAENQTTNQTQPIATTQPPTNTPPPPLSFEETHTVPTWKKRLKIVLLVLVVLFLSTTGLVAAAEMGFLPSLKIERLYGRTALAGLWGGIPADPATALKLAIENPVNLPASLSSQYQANYEGAAGDLANSPFKFSGTAKLEATSLNRYESIKAKLNFDYNPANDEELNLESEFILKDKNLYVKIPQSTGLLFNGIANPTDAGKYFKYPISDSEYAEWQKELSQEQTSPLKLLKEQLPEENIDSILEIISQRVEYLGIGRINGKPATHYRITLNEEDIVQLMVEIYAENQAQADVEVPETETLKEQIGQINIDWDFWVEHGTYLTAQSNISVEVKNKNFEIAVDFTNNSQAINADSVTIEVPADSLIVGSSTISTSDAAARDNARKEDLKVLGEIIESYYSKNGKYPVSTDPTAVDSISWPTGFEGAWSIQGPNGSDDDYFYQSNQEGTTYQLTATLEECDTNGCLYTYPETATITTVDELATPDGRDTQRKTDLAAIASGLKAYRTAKGSFPLSNNVTKLNDLNTQVVKDLVPTYLQAMPQDPQSDKYYGYRSDGKTAYLTSVIEDDSKTECAKIGSYCVYTVTVNP